MHYHATWEKYSKTLQNQNLNDLLLETLAWINFRWQKFPKINYCLSFQKYAVSEEIVAYVIYHNKFLPEYAKTSEGSEKVKFEI